MLVRVHGLNGNLTFEIHVCIGHTPHCIQVAADADRAAAEAMARGRPPPPPPLSPTLVDKLANPEKTRLEARKAVEANAKVPRRDGRREETNFLLFQDFFSMAFRHFKNRLSSIFLRRVSRRRKPAGPVTASCARSRTAISPSTWPAICIVTRRPTMQISHSSTRCPNIMRANSKSRCERVTGEQHV